MANVCQVPLKSDKNTLSVIWSAMWQLRWWYSDILHIYPPLPHSDTQIELLEALLTMWTWVNVLDNVAGQCEAAFYRWSSWDSSSWLDGLFELITGRGRFGSNQSHSSSKDISEPLDKFQERMVGSRSLHCGAIGWVLTPLHYLIYDHIVSKAHHNSSKPLITLKATPPPLNCTEPTVASNGHLRAPKPRSSAFIHSQWCETDSHCPGRILRLSGSFCRNVSFPSPE